MAEQYVPNLGHMPAADARRDAVHVAVAPVVAVELLLPGEHIGLYEDGRAGSAAKHIGVVDPFRRQEVQPGERFWLFLYPGTVTSLRHVWTHPAFKTRAPEVAGHAEQP